MTKVYVLEQVAAALLALCHDRPRDALHILERIVDRMRSIDLDGPEWAGGKTQ